MRVTSLPRLTKKLAEYVQQKERVFVALFFLMFSIFCFRNVLFQPGLVQMTIDYIMPAYPEQVLKLLTYDHSLWSHESFGRVKEYTHSIKYLSFLPALIVGTETFSKAYVVSLLFCAGYSTYLLTRRRVTVVPSLLAGVFYATSPALFMKMFLGQIAFLESIALLPLAWFLFESPSEKSFRWSVPVFALVMVTNQMFIFVPMLFVAYVLSPSSEPVSKKLRKVLIVTVVAIAVNCTIFSSLLTKPSETITFVKNAGALPSLERLSETVFFQSAKEFNKKIEVDGISPFLWFTVAGMLFSFCCMGFKRKEVALYLFPYLMAVFIMNGWTEGFAPLKKVVDDIPFSALLRERDHPIVLAFFPLTLAFAYACEELKKFVEKVVLGIQSGAVVALILFPLLSTYSFVFLTGNLSEHLLAFHYPHEYRRLYLEQESTDDVYRFWWFNSHGAVIYPGWREVAVDPMIMLMPKETFEIRFSGEVRRQLGSFALFSMLRTQHVGQLLGKMNVRDIYYREGVVSIPRIDTLFTSEEIHQIHVKNTSPVRLTTKKDLALLMQQKYVTFREKDESIWKFTNEKWVPRVYVGTVAVATNDLTAFFEVPYDLVFARDLSPSVIEDASAIIVKEDSVIELIQKPQELQSHVATNDGKKGWTHRWGYHVNSEEWHMLSTPEELIVTVDNATIQVRCNGSVVFAKILYSPAVGSLTFSSENSLLKEISPVSSGWFFKWTYVGTKKKETALTIQSKGHNALASIVCADQETMKKRQEEVVRLMKRKTLIVYGDPTPLSGWKVTEKPSRGVVIETNRTDKVYNATISLPFAGMYTISIKTDGVVFLNGKRVGDNEQVWLEENNTLTVYNATWIGRWVMSRKQSEEKQNSTAVFSRESITKYVVNVTTDANATLVFSESYDRGWVLKPLNGCKVHEHYRVNFFANAWKIESKGKNEECRFVIEYEPQQVHSVLFMFSVVSFVGSIVWALRARE